MIDPSILKLLELVIPLLVVSVALGVGAMLLKDRQRMKHGYPIDGPWGQAIHPTNSGETLERVKLLTSENAQLRAELGSIKDRLETLERIATDQPSRLAREIDSLTIDKGGNA